MKITEMELTENQEKLSQLLEADGQQKQQEIPAYQKEVISLAAFDDTGNYLGGITGEIFWNHLHVSLLAIDSSKQKNGVGSQLLAAIEAKAKEHNCTLVILETMSWQAPKFYQKNGYTIFGTVKDIPLKDMAKYYLEKRI